MKFAPVALCLVSLLASASLSPAVEGEDAAKPVADRVPVTAEFRRQEKPQDGTVSDESQILIPALRGCIIVKETARGLALQSRFAGGVKADGFSPEESASLESASAAFIGKPVSLALLDQLSDRIESALEKRGGNMVRASFPDQEITSGTVVILVKPAVVGNVTVHGKPAFGQDFIRENFRARAGDPLSKAAITEDINWLNENPLRRVRATFGAGSGEADIDLALHVQADKTWRVYSGVDNSLSDRLGDERWFLGYQHGDLFHLDHRLTAQYTAGFDFDALRGASLSYEIPLPGRHLLEFSTSISESASEQTGGTGLVNQNGTFQRYAMKYRTPLPSWHGWIPEWHAGASFRDQLYDIPDSTSSVHFFQLESGWRAQRPDSKGTTTVGARLQWTPGWLSSSDEVFQDLGADGADSLILLLNLERSLTLGKAGSLTAKLDAQWSSAALLSADQFAPAIWGRVRGFDEVTGYGDNAASLTMEYQSPLLRTPKAGSLRGIAFLDSALVDNQSTGEDTELVSAGVGFRWLWKNLTASCDLAIPIHANDGIDTDPRLRFSVTSRW